jgi:hypothetical protein
MELVHHAVQERGEQEPRHVGMIVSTGFTLFVVPAAYSLIDDAVAWNDARKGRGEGIFAALRAPRSA